MNRFLDRLIAEFIAGTIDDARFDSTSGQDDIERVLVVITTGS